MFVKWSADSHNKKVLGMLKTSLVCFAIYCSGILPTFANDGDEGNNGTLSKTVEALKSLQGELKASIDAQIGEARCGKDEDCKALAIGANPCGGPEAYQAYSTLDTEVDKLKTLAKKYKTVRKTLHAKTGTMGACVVIPEPQVHCKNQHCIAIPKPGGAIF